MTMLRNKYSQLLAAGLRSVFVEFQKLQPKEGIMESLFNVETSTKAYEDDLIIAGLGPMGEKTENDSFQYSEIVQGGTKRYLHLTYGMGCRYSWELAEDDQYGIVKQVPKALVRAAMFTRQQVPWNILNLGFTTFQTADGVSLFNNQHPLLGGIGATNVGPGVANVISAAGTYPNRPATDIDLSYTALQLATIHADRMIDSMGIPVDYKFTDLWIPAELRFIAEELLGSEGKPYTSDNDKNVLKDLNLKYHVVPFLTSPSAWFLSAPKTVHALKFYDRAPLATDFDDDFDTRSVKNVAFQRFSAGATNWIGVWGSNGP
jgi:hypothetical protein